jgi:hypothetical protein
MRFLGLFLLNPYIRKKRAEKARNQEQERAGKQIEKISYIYSYT